MEQVIGIASKEDIKKWKEQHKEIYRLTATDSSGVSHACYVRKPSRLDLSVAQNKQNDPIRMNETMLRQIWLGGDDAMRTEDELFLGISAKIGDLVQIAECELEKL